MDKRSYIHAFSSNLVQRHSVLVLSSQGTCPSCRKHEYDGCRTVKTHYPETVNWQSEEVKECQAGVLEKKLPLQHEKNRTGKLDTCSCVMLLTL